MSSLCSFVIKSAEDLEIQGHAGAAPSLYNYTILENKTDGLQHFPFLPMNLQIMAGIKWNRQLDK